jgi:hypothetical protein
VPDGLEVTLWAESPLFFNPTSIDVDYRGRIWVAEAVNIARSARPIETSLKQSRFVVPKEIASSFWKTRMVMGQRTHRRCSSRTKISSRRWVWSPRPIRPMREKKCRIQFSS